MQFRGLRIRHFRTIGSTEVELSLEGSLTLVGANNSGKTNILRAVEMFFTGHDNELGYSRANDLTFGASSAKTSLLATFEGDVERIENNGEVTYKGADGEFYEDFDRLCQLYGRGPADNIFTLSLVFSPSGVPVYQFFPNLKKPNDNASQASISRTQRQLVTELLAKFSCHYIPSAKSMEQLYGEVLNPFLTRVAARAVEPQLKALESSLAQVATGINQELHAVGLDQLSASFSLPGAGVESILSRFEFELSDPHRTPVVRKGQGIQSAAFLAALRWVTAEEKREGGQTVWLLEEPESYLHPELMGTVRDLLTRLGDDSRTILSTHALAFVPDDVNLVVGVELDSDGRTCVQQFVTAVEAGDRLRRALGVRFSDYYNLSELNVAVEGLSDRELIEWYLRQVPAFELELPRLRKAQIREFGGTTHLSGWLRATYLLVRTERALVVMFDGDHAGEKERSALQSYFGQRKVPFQANREYVVVRTGFPVEALFPDEWLVQAQSEHPSWFHDLALDASGTLHSMKMKDEHKSSIMAFLKRMAEAEDGNSWRGRLDGVATALDEALRVQVERLECKPTALSDPSPLA